jgi:ADP-heptose:LPS heptosyltransferase
MIELPRVTLMVADTYYYGGAVASLKKCMLHCKFARVIFFTNIPIKVEGVEVIQIDELDGKDGYSHFMLKEAYKYIHTEFCLVVQHDSWVLDATQFDERLYDVDYCGALWLENDGLSNGNGGFSWRSNHLMTVVGQDEMINATSPEDVALCRTYRRYLEKTYNLIWASDEVCEQFSFELRTPCIPTFGFHGQFNLSYQPVIVITRKAACGDVVALQPVLEYYHNKGYRVVLNTLPQFYNLFIQHYFLVYNLDNIDGRLLKGAKQINLDMAYEGFPEKNHLQAYYDICGITDGELKKPKLTLSFNPALPENKLFKKYAVFHIDQRAQPGRNLQGNIEWWRISSTLMEKGYTIVQIGKGEHVNIPYAVQMNTATEPFLMWVLGGADLFVGIDSGPANIAVSMGVKSAIFFGAVDAKKIYPDLTDVEVIEYENCCPLPKCWHSVISVEGVPCMVDKLKPTCVQFTTEMVFNAINKLING